MSNADKLLGLAYTQPIFTPQNLISRVCGAPCRQLAADPSIRNCRKRRWRSASL